MDSVITQVPQTTTTAAGKGSSNSTAASSAAAAAEQRLHDENADPNANSTAPQQAPPPSGAGGNSTGNNASSQMFAVQKNSKKKSNFLCSIICCFGKRGGSGSRRRHRRKDKDPSGGGGGGASIGGSGGGGSGSGSNSRSSGADAADAAGVIASVGASAPKSGGGGIAASSSGGTKALLQEIRPEDSNKMCIVIDLDETLVHSSFKPISNADFIVPVEIDGTIHQVYVLKRPHVDEYLCKMGELFECVLFTASLAKYADPVTDLLDKWDVFRYRLFRESCVFHRGNYVKDLGRLGRELHKIIIVDNSPASYIFHPDNAVPVASWFDDMNDRELLDLIPFFERISKADNVYALLKSGMAGGTTANARTMQIGSSNNRNSNGSSDISMVQR